ncbi:MAG: iron-containing alcohol dehydrogenase [Lachnospiraceae bacterium]
MAYDTYGFFMPTKLIFFNGAFRKTAEEAKKFGDKVLVVTDQVLLETGLLEPLFEDMKSLGMEYVVWDKVVPNPRDKDIDEGGAFAREAEAKVIVAVGGGSSMDTAKAMGAIMTNGGTVRQWYGDKLEKDIAPLICVPTTCGTGSEVTHESIINDTELMQKKCIWGEHNSVKIAILDPQLLKGLPAHLLASTGVDALTHAVESYTCTAASPVTDALGMKAIALIGKSLVNAVETKSEESLTDMMSASVIAGMAFGNSNVAAVHCMAEALGGFYDIPHGVANAMLLPCVSRYNVPGAAKKYAEVAEALGVDTTGMSDEEAAYAGIDHIEQMCRRLKIPKFSEEKKIDPKDFEFLAEAAAIKGPTKVNPVFVDKEKYIELFYKAYQE